jgi:outer membrane receptor protein involved in Fe transport
VAVVDPQRNGRDKRLRRPYRKSSEQFDRPSPRIAHLAAGAAVGCLTVAGLLPAAAQDQSVPPPTQPPPQTQGPTPQGASPQPQEPSVAPARQSPLPEIKVTTAKPKPKPAQPTAAKPQGGPRVATQATAQPALTASSADGNAPATPAQAAVDQKMKSLDAARENLLPKIGASTDTINREFIASTPQGDNTPLDKLILQLPGVSYDSAVSNPNFHVRNEYANVQFRINGVMLPEGVSSLGPFIDTNFIGSLSLLTGTLPAQYGLRTAGVLDITSRSFAVPSGEVSVYGGSRQTFTPSFDYGGSIGNSEYFVTARGNWNALGLENPTPSLNATHDQTQQGKFFGYASTLLDDSTRFSVISAASYSAFQIPNNPGQTPLGDFGPTNYSSSTLNEREYDTYIANIVALQKHSAEGDAQLAVYSRYADIHFIPDVFGDLVFNDVASNVERQSILTGVQGDASYTANDRHTLRAGFAVSGEQTNVSDVATVLPGDVGAVTGPPITIADNNSKVGWNLGVYLQDEWKLTNQLTLNWGLRFDQMYQFVDANQLSPRVALIYKPFDATTIHAGFARYFTPPYQAQAAQSNIALFTNTTNQPDVPFNDPVLPERSSYYDVGVDQKVLPGLTMGLDAYYKNTRDQIDDGQFGAAVVLTQFNYARGYSEGGEAKLKYKNGNFNAYAKFSYNITEAIDVVSNQYLIDAADYTYLLTHWHYTDDMQRMTGSAGASYRWYDTIFTSNLTYGSGLRVGELPEVVPNSLHSTPYAVVNVGIAHDYKWSPDFKPLTLRFDVVNLFDQIYELRTGSGIGEFAPQYGARRGFYVGVSQKL